jgi:GntR family transcriptional regulator
VEESWDATEYERVYAHLRDRITAENLQPGTRLPGERALAEFLGVSRETVRSGMRLAEEQGLIKRSPARGTFVAERRIRQDLGRMRSFDLTVRGADLSPTYESVSVEVEGAGRTEAAALGVPPGERLLVVEAVGTGDSRPLAYYRSSIPPGVAERLPKDPDWRAFATYQVIGEALGISSMQVSQRWEAVNLPGGIARLLDVPDGAAALRSSGVFADSNGTPLELRIGWYPGVRYEFMITRSIDLP